MNMTDAQALLLAKALVLMGQGIGAGLALIGLDGIVPQFAIFKDKAAREPRFGEFLIDSGTVKGRRLKGADDNANDQR